MTEVNLLFPVIFIYPPGKSFLVEGRIGDAYFSIPFPAEYNTMNPRLQMRKEVDFLRLMPFFPHSNIVSFEYTVKEVA